MVRLCPAPHGRTPVADYELVIVPQPSGLNWQFDGANNRVARATFARPTDRLTLSVAFTARLTPVNPFDFFLEPGAQSLPFPFLGSQAEALAPYLQLAQPGPRFTAWFNALDLGPGYTVTVLTDISQRIAGQIDYEVREDHGIQDCDETLNRMRGSCRDTAWLLVQTMRRVGVPARLVSGYLIQLANDAPDGPREDSIELHAWTEAFLPGAGWIGFDTTSGLLCAEGHIPLAAGPTGLSVAPVAGSHGASHGALTFDMSVERLAD